MTAVLERLTNRLGGQCARSALPCRPSSGAPGGCAPRADTDDGWWRRAGGTGRAQPPWLLAQPRPLQVQQSVPQYGGALRLEDLPERIEAGWWDGFDVTRDYFVAHSRAGERLWVFRDRRGDGWYLHGKGFRSATGPASGNSVRPLSLEERAGVRARGKRGKQQVDFGPDALCRTALPQQLHLPAWCLAPGGTGDAPTPWAIGRWR